MAEIVNRYRPRRVSPPGGTLQDLLAQRGMAQNELAERMGLTAKAVNEIAKGKSSITPDTALKLERALGMPADFWLAREQHFQAWLARQRAEKEQGKRVAWLTKLPVRELIKAGAVRPCSEKAEQVGELLRFFGVASTKAWEEVYASPQAAFRRSGKFECDVGATAAWLRLGERAAQAVKTEPYVAERFLEVLRDAVPLTRRPVREAMDELRASCASVGVALVLVREVGGCRASGVTRWLTPSKALVQLSDRHKTEDHLWFTFFHEAGHILLHKKKEVFLEGGRDGGAEEREADRFAQRMLVPDDAYRELQDGGAFSSPIIEGFSERHRVAPGIVVGRLQHDKAIPFNALRHLQRRFEIPDA
ncbi:MAG TPA: HigA family addiction module antitoxin [Anaeromyxobacteraceae bacterium]|nr:HigA family addiction module antitoxin [Anaeromyxobacteraceae bacterium]